ncbi:hypothetical protein [Asanoa siamensis]|uniref:Uncharacterized protein n=1 Tax=Asanoa siamensis TaxID=926357 RepID=A0ABQ4CWI7_9ACTN|nr:hypothetical protein [Asanoa siamensis]GIF75657.1 hypothetical protein Asi02nite_51750 [Asanoa siamensis]
MANGGAALAPAVVVDVSDEPPDGEDEAPWSTDDLRLQTAVRALLALSVIMAITATLDEFGVTKVVRFVVSSVLCGLAFDRLRVWHRGKRT